VASPSRALSSPYLPPARIRGVGQAGQTGEIIVILHGRDALHDVNKFVAALLKILSGCLQGNSALIQ
jgi:hypothetical protein